MKRNRYDVLFAGLLIVGVLLMGYGIFQGASTQILITTDGISFI